MRHLDAAMPHKIDKKYVTAMTIFAKNNIPGTDEFTLNKFLELMNTTGSFGTVTDEQLVETMRAMTKYIPGICTHSLGVLIELLQIYILPLKVKSKEGFLPAPDNSQTKASGQEIDFSLKGKEE
jgi:hypothetical protein